MYRTCIFCSADLGDNKALEEFPVGARLAFDAHRGRLWAVCGRCARWNLAPIEERWEAVESAEKLFCDARLRVHSENVGLARLPDGTGLIRVGEALAGELAAWRYGGQLRKRRAKYLLGIGVGITAGGAFVAGLPLLAAAGIPTGLINVVSLGYQYRRGQRIVYRVAAADSPTGRELRIRRVQLNHARIERRDHGRIALRLPAALDAERTRSADGDVVWQYPPLVLEGAAAQAVIGRALVDANHAGASRRTLARAVDLLAEAGEAETYLHRVAERGASLGLPRVSDLRVHVKTVHVWRQVMGTFRGEIVPPTPHPGGRKLPRPEALALEMALHEESERRALAGELAALETRWREAEEIAAIADALPDDPLDRLRPGVRP